VQYRDITISRAKTFDVVHVQYRDITISKIFRCRTLLSISYTICDTGAAGHTGHVPAQPTGPASWSSTRLDGLNSCVIVFTPFPAAQHVNTPSNVEFSCLLLLQCPGRGMDCRQVVSSYRNDGDLMMIHMISFKYALTQASFNTMRFKGKDSASGIDRKLPIIRHGATIVVAP
jgi:hypothetical protein